MKTPIRAKGKALRSFVPVAPFEFETFELPVRPVNRHTPTSIPVAQPAKLFLPSASLQGPGLMSLHLGARSVGYPAALPSPSCTIRSRSQTNARGRTNRHTTSHFK